MRTLLRDGDRPSRREGVERVFRQHGAAGAGPKQPTIETSDRALGVLDRIQRTRVTQTACNAVDDDVHARRLTLIDDVMLDRLPKAQRLPALLDLAAWRVDANRQAHPI